MPTKITKTSWPKHKVETIECRKRDLVIRIADWTRQSMETGEPAYDVEIYDKGIYDWHQSKSFTLLEMPKATAKRAAIQFANDMIRQLLK